MNLENFYLLAPNLLPVCLENIKNGSFLKQIPDHVLALDLSLNDKAMHVQATIVLDQLSNMIESFNLIKDDATESYHNKINDQAFNIFRVDGHRGFILIYSVYQSLYALQNEMLATGTSLNRHEWGLLRSAYCLLLKLYSGTDCDINFTALKQPPKKFLARSKRENAYSRWIQGHYVFMSIIQGMIVSLNFFYNSVKQLNFIDANKFLFVATALMSSSESAIKFASDFTRFAYSKEVRPTLTPPIAPPGMSGLRWRDHEYLIKVVLAKIRPILSNPPSEISAQVEHYRSAMAATYDSHKLICSKFIGTNSSSLLSTDPAIEVLEKYKQGRLMNFCPRSLENDSSH